MFNYFRFLCVIITAFYCYSKIDKKRMSGIELIRIILLANVDSLIVLYFYSKNKYFTFLIAFTLFAIYNFIFDHAKKGMVIVKSIISFALAYVFYSVSATLTCLLTLALPQVYIDKYGMFLCIIIQVIIVQILFFIKRLHGGMPFLKKEKYILGGSILGGLIIITALYINASINNNGFLTMMLVLLILAILIFIYWRTSITRYYLERLSIRNIDSLNAELEEKNTYINSLLEDKERIEKINHKNYKLVPAMQGAVMHYLDGVKELVEVAKNNPALEELAATKDMTVEDYVEEGNRLIKELQAMQEEWKDIVNSDNIDGSKDIPASGVSRIDYILSYMNERSKKEDYTFKVDIDCELKGLTEKIITEEDLSTLVADLIENAIIATKYNEGKYILVSFGMMKKEYIIDIYDSGIPFDKEVLAKYGQEQITTHADDSGSGIGMMQTYEILSKCGASLFIDEFSQNEGMYTKRLSVVFNKKQQYVLYTKRDDEDIAYLKKRSDLIVVKK